MAAERQTEDEGKSPLILASQLREEVDRLGLIGEGVRQANLLIMISRLVKFAEQTEARQNELDAEVARLREALHSLVMNQQAKDS